MGVKATVRVNGRPEEHDRGVGLRSRARDAFIRPERERDGFVGGNDVEDDGAGTVPILEVTANLKTDPTARRQSAERCRAR